MIHVQSYRFLFKTYGELTQFNQVGFCFKRSRNRPACYSRIDVAFLYLSWPEGSQHAKVLVPHYRQTYYAAKTIVYESNKEYKFLIQCGLLCYMDLLYDINFQNNIDGQIFIKSNGANFLFFRFSLFQINVRISKSFRRMWWLLLTLLY